MRELMKRVQASIDNVSAADPAEAETKTKIAIGDRVIALTETTDTCFSISGRIGTVQNILHDSSHYGIIWDDMDMYGNSTFSALTPDCVVKYTGEKWQRMLHMYWALLQHYEQKEIERMEAPSTLHEQIRAARKEAGLTQAELAEKLGVSLRTIESWEAGVRQPRYKHGNIIERILSFKKKVVGA